MDDVRLLLADKNLSYLEIARKMLRFHDEAYQVDVATSGEECLKKLNENGFDLLLLDYDIDDKRGLEILSQIINADIDVPVVMLVDESREDIAFRSLEKGAYDYIMKVRGYLTALPFTVGKVLEKRKMKIATTIDEEPISKSKPSFSIAEENIVEQEITAKDESPFREAYYILDRKGRFISTNRILEETLNYLEEELLELTLADIIPPERESAYYQWLATIDMGSNQQVFKTEIIGKHGDRHPAEITISPMRDRYDEIISYKGRIKFKVPENGLLFPTNGHFDQTRMINEMVQLIHDSHEISFNHLLERISQIVCKLFQFKRATLALLDRRRKTYIKQIMIGYTNTNGKADDRKILEVPQEVIDRVFVNQSKVKVIYHNHDSTNNNSLRLVLTERRSQARRTNNQWHPKDIIIFNLVDHHNKTFGYISLDEPLNPVVPPRDIFHNMEIFSGLASLAIENFYHFASLEKRNRRLKQLLVTSNLFRLHLSIAEMMKEIVWAIKFSMNFNLVLLGLINRKSKELQIKSVACDDRIKTLQLKELSIPGNDLQTLLKKQYRRGKSYLVNKFELALRRLKDLYWDTKIDATGERYWHWWALLVIPIYGHDGKILGFILADDPADCLLPTTEEIHTLEILANQISVAIENRLAYVRLRERVSIKKDKTPEIKREKSEGGIKKLVDYFFK
ncbi:MAG: response regulator [bacterium]|nr:MAG: response regulator [bacterium]